MAIGIKEILTLVGIVLTFIVSLAGLFVSIHNSRKTTFINSVTASRTKWMEEIRNNIGNFCGLSLLLALSQMDEKEKRQVIEKLEILRFLIKLQLNRSDPFDKKIIEKIDTIPNFTEPIKISELELQLKKLTELTQDLMKLEWEGIKAETIKGNLTKKQKQQLLDKHLTK